MLNLEQNDLKRNRWQKIGIIGGLGPRASAAFYRSLIDLCSQKYNAVLDHDYPSILLASLANQVVSDVGELNLVEMDIEFQEILKIFDNQGIEVVAVPCNSVYAKFDRFKKISKAKIVDLPKEIGFAASKMNVDNAMILCSHGLMESKAYNPYFLEAGIEPCYPDLSTQTMVDNWIFQVMRGDSIRNLTTELTYLVENLAKQFGVIVIACSELSVLLESYMLQSYILDSMKVLAEVTLSLAYIT